MRKFLIIVLFTVGGALWLKNYIAGGQLLAHAEAHPYRKGTSTVLFYIGRGYELFNRPEKAAEYYRRVADKYPRSRYAEEAQFGLASAYERLKLNAKALEEYKEFLEKFPRSRYQKSVSNNLQFLER